MLKILRKKGVAKKVLWFVAIVIIISFGFFGTAYLITGQQRITTAGSIFGKEVTFPEFDKAYRDVRIQALIRHGDQVNDYLATRNLDADTWDHLILLEEAKRRGIRVKDEEVVNAIQQYQFFHRDGRFDNLLYKDIVRYIFNVKARTFEETIRNSIKLNKLFAQETFSATVSEEEIREAFRRQNEKVQVSYAFISPEQYKNEATFDEESAREYFEEHREDFSVPQSINVEYIQIPFEKEELSLEGTVAAELSPKEQAQQLAQEIYQKFQENPEMSEVVDEYDNIELQTSGFFSMERPDLSMGMSYELLKRLFELPEGQISQPYETSNGYFIAKVAEKKRAYIPDYEEAKEKVKDTILRNAAMDITRDKADQFLDQIKEEYKSTLPHDFADAVKSIGLELGQTPLFRRGQYLPEVGLSNEFQETAFSLNEQEPISDIVETQRGFYILHLDEYVPADQELYEQQKDTIAQILLLQKRNEIFEEFLSRLRLEANLIDNVSKLKQENQTE